MAAAWTDAETFKLIELWGDQSVQEELEGCKKNSKVFSRLSDQMRTAGYERTLAQCRDKIKKLKGDYRKVKDANKQTGNKRKKSKFYEKMNEILHDKHSVTPPIILDTSSSTSAVESSNDDVDEIPETDLEEEAAEESLTGKEPSKDEGEDTAASGAKEGVDTVASVAKEKGSNEDIKPQIAGIKRKKHVKIDKMEKVIDKMCDKISSQQGESDRIFAELEEKRMKLEHEMLKMQQDRQREESERAERQRREDREFQLKLFSMLYGRQQSNAPVFSGQQYHYPSSGYCASSESDYYNDPDYRIDGNYHDVD